MGFGECMFESIGMKYKKPTDNLPHENMYGHLKRLNWIISHIREQDSIIEFGCGTGYMISYPLIKMGYSNLTGIDLDEESITYGQRFFELENLNRDYLKAMDISRLDKTVDVVIASEVFEHIESRQLDQVMKNIGDKLNPRGRLLVTVPNGYGCFEIESFLWNKVGLGKLLKWLLIIPVITRIKRVIFGRNVVEFPYVATLAGSPHVQRFTYNSIKKLLQDNGFEVIHITGSTLFAGPLSDLLFTGIKPVMYFNCLLGKWFPRIASGFYLSCRRMSAEKANIE